MNHGFHALSHLPESDRIRFTTCESARTEVLGRLARLNRERWLAEQVEEISFSEKASALRGTRAKAKLTMVQGGLL